MFFDEGEAEALALAGYWPMFWKDLKPGDVFVKRDYKGDDTRWAFLRIVNSTSQMTVQGGYDDQPFEQVELRYLRCMSVPDGEGIPLPSIETAHSLHEVYAAPSAGDTDREGEMRGYWQPEPEPPVRPVTLIREADPELERLLREEEEIEHSVRHAGALDMNCEFCFPGGFDEDAG